MDSSKKLLQRFENGDKQVVVEYQETDESGRRIWLQKTVLMSQDTVYDRKTKRESVVVHGMILFRDTSEFHSREEREKIQLQDAFRAADSASRAKTEFMNRMSTMCARRSMALWACWISSAKTGRMRQKWTTAR